MIIFLKCKIQYCAFGYANYMINFVFDLFHCLHESGSDESDIFMRVMYDICIIWEILQITGSTMMRKPFWIQWQVDIGLNSFPSSDRSRTENSDITSFLCKMFSISGRWGALTLLRLRCAIATIFKTLTIQP